MAHVDPIKRRLLHEVVQRNVAMMRGLRARPRQHAPHPLQVLLLCTVGAGVLTCLAVLSSVLWPPAEEQQRAASVSLPQSGIVGAEVSLRPITEAAPMPVPLVGPHPGHPELIEG